MAIVVDAPQGPQVSSGSELIAVASLTAVGNALPVPINGAAVLTIDNRSDAAILVQLLTASQGISSPYVEIVDPGKKRAFSYQLPMTEVILSNATFKGLPQPFLDFLFPLAAADQNKTDGFIVLSWTSVPLSIDDGQNDNSVTIVNPSGQTLNVSTPIGTVLTAGMPSVGQIMNYVGPKADASVGTIPLQGGLVNAISLLAYSRPATLTRIQGNVTGVNYLAANVTLPQATPQVFALPLVHPSDTSVLIFITDAAAGATTFLASAILASVMSQPQNFGASPLIVQPASGSSQTVVPGTAAAVSAQIASQGGVGFEQIVGAAFARPTSIYAVSVAAFGFKAAAISQPDAGMVAFGLKGTTTNKEVMLAMLALNFPATTTANSPRASNATSLVFPYPLSGAALFPGDANLEAILQTDMDPLAGYTISIKDATILIS